MIQFDQVSKRYPTGQVGLEGVSFHINAGEMAFLTGHSGAGKSTLLKLVMLMERATHGQVRIAGRNLRSMGRGEIPAHRREIGVVFQNHQLLFDRSVFENVALPLQISGYSRVDIGKRVRAALDQVGLLDKEKLPPISLSGGEQQRVGIARAVVHKPKLLLADEPTGNLDPGLSAEIMTLFERFNQVGVTVLIASHDMALIERMRHRVLTLNQGRLVADG
ncbi:cell division ATP-binding protein FtsE [Aestuariirhabdus litorea]|uniref:Cell division ATP-binding protein FtsE n=1 Tax=Aestuariirhabdus litorea TaxID=2528527 RepID=A0A3P3VLZ8_9GAMM|nr:cell division ATP-binding protein FtsE [Aestuariirhabdus litorea]RRJ82686.1 cell division ATP-binding protein FtsE [Aestuariirhabdus litorea]RWW92846.1 cell division ATP-binding protein FtsE [Endozoicomonadaceae bacterium GTF-13]